MLAHDLRLAFRSIRRNPILSALMISAIAVGIAASMVAITLYHARSGHPIPWKNDRLYAVTIDTRDDDPDRGLLQAPRVSAVPAHLPRRACHLWLEHPVA